MRVGSEELARKAWDENKARCSSATNKSPVTVAKAQMATVTAAKTPTATVTAAKTRTATVTAAKAQTATVTAAKTRMDTTSVAKVSPAQTAEITATKAQPIEATAAKSTTTASEAHHHPALKSCQPTNRKPIKKLPSAVMKAPEGMVEVAALKMFIAGYSVLYQIML